MYPIDDYADASAYFGQDPYLTRLLAAIPFNDDTADVPPPVYVDAPDANAGEGRRPTRADFARGNAEATALGVTKPCDL